MEKTDKPFVRPEFALSLTKYNDAAAIAHRVLAKVCKLATEGDGATILSLCEQGDKLLEEECAKVYKGKKISKGGFLFFYSMLDEFKLLDQKKKKKRIPGGFACVMEG